MQYNELKALPLKEVIKLSDNKEAKALAHIH
jgi:hypothetical protein